MGIKKLKAPIKEIVSKKRYPDIKLLFLEFSGLAVVFVFKFQKFVTNVEISIKRFFVHFCIYGV